MLVLYVLQRLQGSLPLNPTDVGAVPAAAGVQHRRQLRHQHELAELRRRVDDEPPHPDGRAWPCRTSCRPRSGCAVAVALIRGLVRRRSATIGNFWVDLVRGTVRVLLPLALRGRRRPREPGRHPEPPRRPEPVTTVEGATQSIPGGPVRQPGGHQGARHQRRRLAQRQLGPPASRTPTGSPTCSRSVAASCSSRSPSPTPSAGWSKDQRQGWVRLRRDVRPVGRRRRRSPSASRSRGNPELDRRSAPTRRSPPTRRGGNMEGKEVRFGPAGLAACSRPSTTGTSTGAVNCAHDSFTPARRHGAARQHDARRGRAPAASAPASTGC